MGLVTIKPVNLKRQIDRAERQEDLKSDNTLASTKTWFISTVSTFQEAKQKHRQLRRLSLVQLVDVLLRYCTEEIFQTVDEHLEVSHVGDKLLIKTKLHPNGELALDATQLHQLAARLAELLDQMAVQLKKEIEFRIEIKNRGV